MVHVPDRAAAVDALRARLRGGDVVLVKASHSVGLEQVALTVASDQAGQAGSAEPAQ